MYWRQRSVTPEDLLRMYGVHIALAVSVLCNVVLFFTRPDPKKMVGQQIKADFDKFARQVTTQLLDSSYITFEQSTMGLFSGELAPSVQQQLFKEGILPKSQEEVKATARTL